MNKKTNTAAAATRRRHAASDLRELGHHPEHRPIMTALYRRAEIQLRKQRKQQQRKQQRSQAGQAKPAADHQRLLHELQVHQIELEMQNAELQKARDELELTLETYTDLYDFAPVGYLSLDELGQILEVNLTGAALIGVERSRLINRRLPALITPASRPVFLAFLEQVFAGAVKPVCEAIVFREDGASFWANFHGASAIAVSGSRKWCRVAFADITARKQAEEAHRRLEALGVANQELKQKIAQRQAVEEALKQSMQHQRQLLEQSRRMQEQLRDLSRQVLHAQEEERKRISRELHDVIAQTLTGINLRLDVLKKEAGHQTDGFDRNLARTQLLIGKSVDIVHQFARELRPAVLDDLGLIPALHSYMKDFAARTGVQTHLTVPQGGSVEQIDIAHRTVLFRVAQEALTNVARHAKASRVEVSLQKLSDGIGLKITDDGKAFDVERVLHTKGGGRLGLLGMRERLEMVGGNFGVESAPGKGTTITAQIPLIDRPLRGGGRRLADHVR